MPTDPRGEARRRELLEATLRVVGRGGVGAVTHRVVAREAGVPLGSTTYYFKTKEEMVAQALELVAERETSSIVGLRAEHLPPSTRCLCRQVAKALVPCAAFALPYRFLRFLRNSSKRARSRILPTIGA